MAMNPRTHPRGAPPDFSMKGLPPNPRPKRLTDAMWWIICMHDLLVKDSAHGGDYVNKPGGHNAGENLPDYGEGDPRTDHSIRRRPDRTGPWWKEFTCAEDWTFHNPDEMQKYAMRLYRSLKDPNDTRGDDVFQYFIGDTDGDPHIEGWHEYNDDDVTGDKTHAYHQHRQYRRNIVGSFWHMWKALTIDMGWSFADWQKSVQPKPVEGPMFSIEEFLDTEIYIPYDPDRPMRKIREVLGWGSPSAQWHKTTYAMVGKLTDLVEEQGRLLAKVAAGEAADDAALQRIEALAVEIRDLEATAPPAPGTGEGAPAESEQPAAP